MRFLVFGLSISSAWGNGHFAVYRGLSRALVALGHDVIFVERADPRRAAYADLSTPPYAALFIYDGWERFAPEARSLARAADVVVLGSRFPDGPRAMEDAIDLTPARKVYYDLDLALTLDRLEATGGASGGKTPYVYAEHVPRFDLVCANALGRPLEVLRETYGARRAVALLAACEPEVSGLAPAAPREFRSALTFYGEYGAGRVDRIERLFFQPARRRPDRRFVAAGPGFGRGRLPPGLTYFPYVPPAARSDLYAGADAVLVVQRRSYGGAGPSLSLKLFDSVGAGVCALVEPFPGLESLFRVGRDVVPVRTTDDVLAALELPSRTKAIVGRRGRYRVQQEHTYAHRARDLVRYLEAS